MTTVLICLAIGVLIPHALAGIGGYLRVRQLGSLDNHNPRQQALQATGAAQRALAAQSNAWEQLAVFTAAVVSAAITDANPGTAANLAIAWVAFRVMHAVCYLADWASARTGVFLGGVVCAIWLFFLGL